MHHDQTDATDIQDTEHDGNDVHDDGQAENEDMSDEM